MLETSNQVLIPEYAHKLNIFLIYQLKNNFLFMNKRVTDNLNSTIQFIIGYYLGKRTTQSKRNNIIKNIRNFSSLIIDFTKVINSDKIIKAEINNCQEYINLVINDLTMNQNGNINSSGSCVHSS